MGHSRECNRASTQSSHTCDQGTLPASCIKNALATFLLDEDQSNTGKLACASAMGWRNVCASAIAPVSCYGDSYTRGIAKAGTRLTRPRRSGGRSPASLADVDQRVAGRHRAAFGLRAYDAWANGAVASDGSPLA